MPKAPLRLFAAAFLTIVTACNAPAAWAADAKLCNAYVAEAVKAAESVRTNSCGYDLSNPQWSRNANERLRWCLKANVESVDKERKNRTTKDTACQLCRDYASQATQAVMTAIQNGCTGLDGPRWSQDDQVHFNWCMGLKGVVDVLGIKASDLPDTRTTVEEQRAREAGLGACLAQKGSQPLVAQPSPPNPTARPSDAATSTALQRPGPRTSSSVDSAQQSTQVTTKKKFVKQKKPKDPGVQVTRPCKLPDGRPCPAPSGALSAPNSGSGTTLMRSGGSTPGLGLR